MLTFDIAFKITAIFTSDIFALRHYVFSDDMQCYCSGPSSDVPPMTASQVQRCATDFSDYKATTAQRGQD